MWQDYVLTAGSVVFIVALLPAVFSDAKPPKTTSLMTAAVLYVFALTDVSLHLYLTAAITFLTAATWTILAAQKRLEPDPRGLHCDDAQRA